MTPRLRYVAMLMALPLAGAFAQGNAPRPAAEPGAQPRELSVAPNAPAKTPERESQAGGQVQSTGTPANICEELVAYLRQPKPAGAASAPQSPAPNAPAAQGAPADRPVSPGQTAPPVDRTQQASGQSAPIAGNDHQAPAATQPDIDEVQALLEANDRPGCQDAARRMRRAGVALPPGLLALAALRQDLLGR
jgi:hypothetical protein